jgi:hypothetical protein
MLYSSRRHQTTVNRENPNFQHPARRERLLVRSIDIDGKVCNAVQLVERCPPTTNKNIHSSVQEEDHLGTEAFVWITTWVVNRGKFSNLGEQAFYSDITYAYRRTLGRDAEQEGRISKQNPPGLSQLWIHLVLLELKQLPLSTPSLVVVVSLCLLCKLSLKQDQKQWSSCLSRVCHLCPFAFFDFSSQFVMQCVWISTNVFANWFEVSRSLNWSWDLYFQFCWKQLGHLLWFLISARLLSLPLKSITIARV